MSVNGETRGEAVRQFDQNLTRNVINATGPNASPRIRQVIGSLVQHLHDFCRENEITMDEFRQTLDFINAAGRTSDEKRNESLMVADILGLETLCDEITYKLVDEADSAPTTTAILGPFWRKDAPTYPMDTSIVLTDLPGAEHVYLFGTVTDYATGKPVRDTELDVWQNAPNGLYEQQDPNQPDMNLRGRFLTGSDGRFSFYCIRPTSYPIPDDGPGGALLKMLDRHRYRPAHIHLIITAPGYKPIITQLFDRRDKYIANDAVFAVKDSLIADFKPRIGDPKATFELTYDFKLASFEEAKRRGVEGATDTSTAEA